MYRDFTNEEMERLLGYVQDEDGKISNQLAWGAIDYLADLASYSDLDIADYVDDIDNYHKKLIDAENMTAKKIKNIFKAVHQVDDDTLTNIDIINGLTEALYKYMYNLKTKIVIGKKGFEGNVTEPLALPKEEYLKKIKDDFQFTSAKKCAEMYDAYRDGDIKKVEKYLEREVNDLTRNVADFGGQPGATVKKIREEIVVDLYRLINPDSAKKFDELFDSCENATISELDRYNIMYLAYTAEEPYKSLLLNSLGKFKLGKFDPELKQSGFEPGKNVINFTTGNSWLRDLDGAYTSFFHECGHAIDYHARVEEKEWYSVSYELEGNYDVIYDDIIDRVQLEIAEYIDTKFGSLDDRERYKYINEISYCIVYEKGDVSHFSDMTERTICKRVISKMCSDLNETIDREEDDKVEKDLTENKKTENYKTEIGKLKTDEKKYKYACASDIYGGATDKTVAGESGHDLFKDKDKDGIWDDGEGYFFPDKDGERTKYNEKGEINNENLVLEAWAEFFSYSITGNKKALDWTSEYLPNTVNKFSVMAEDMKDIISE